MMLKQGVLFLINFSAPPPDYCLNSPCQNNGICQSLTDTYSCECPETHTGRNCEESKEWMMHLSICHSIIGVVIAIRPVITEPPQTTTGRLYSQASLTCRATGSPTPSIHWYKDNKLIINKNTDPSVLVFTELTLNDRGFYRCEARNIIDGKNVSVLSSTVLLNITSKNIMIILNCGFDYNYFRF